MNFVALLLRHTHKQLEHAGPSHVISNIRQKYIIHRCVECFRFRTGTQANQLMGQLPSERVNRNDVFSSVALDYFGPIILRCEMPRGQRHVKGWGMIIVCMATRAVHLEPISSYSAQSFINGLTRFVSRRGLCKVINTDLGTSMTGGKTILDNECENLIKKLTPDA